MRNVQVRLLCLLDAGKIEEVVWSRRASSLCWLWLAGSELCCEPPCAYCATWVPGPPMQSECRPDIIRIILSTLSICCWHKSFAGGDWLICFELNFSQPFLYVWTKTMLLLCCEVLQMRFLSLGKSWNSSVSFSVRSLCFYLLCAGASNPDFEDFVKCKNSTLLDCSRAVAIDKILQISNLSPILGNDFIQYNTK